MAKTESAHRCYLSLGSNCAMRKRKIEEALQELESRFGEINYSDIYDTDSVSGDGSCYKNCVVECSLNEPYEVILRETKEMEARAGRDRESRRRGVVPLDIDVVIWDGEIVRPKDYSYEYFQQGYRKLRDK